LSDVQKKLPSATMTAQKELLGINAENRNCSKKIPPSSNNYTLKKEHRRFREHKESSRWSTEIHFTI